MAALTIEEALKKFNRRFYSYHVNQDRLSIFSENVKRYVDMTIKAIHENESEEHLKNITNSFLKAIYSAERYEINTDKRIDTDLMELEGGQKLVRFYDPSGNLIEVRTPVSYN